MAIGFNLESIEDEDFKRDDGMSGILSDKARRDAIEFPIRVSLNASSPPKVSCEDCSHWLDGAPWDAGCTHPLFRLLVQNSAEPPCGGSHFKEQQ